ncbi:hypothetical protein RJ639_045216 [Escallonia herrerae]|uniref:RRM domain-containing protein n=1 Tax=Escallonia herrerae TaxID=1293975 RepID=A0AA88W8C0_9ASTE|nr:hypothetical protein RJ639_045216 [Escallonia herrerae]
MESEPRKLFIGGFPRETTEEALKLHFNQYGVVQDCQVIKDRVTGKGRGFGFVTFKDPSVADRVLCDLHNILGKRVRLIPTSLIFYLFRVDNAFLVEVKLAIPKGERSQKQYYQGCLNSLQQQKNGVCMNTCNGSSEYNKKIFVGGLPPGLTEEEFKNYFEKFGTVVDACFIYDKQNNRPRGFGFVTFDSLEAVEEALHGGYHELNEKTVEVKRAEPKDRNTSYTSNRGTYDDAGLNFGGFWVCPLYTCLPPYGILPGYNSVMNPHHVGGLPGVFNGYGYGTYLCYGSPVHYPAGISNSACDNCEASRFAGLQDAAGKCVRKKKNDNALWLEPNGAEDKETPEAHSMPCNSGNQEPGTSISYSSSYTDDDGDTEVPTLASLHLMDNPSSAQSNISENQIGADGQVYSCDSS